MNSRSIGVVEWFRPGEHERVEQVLSDLNALGVTNLRTGISWADYHTKEGMKWYDWMLPRLAQSVNVLPCFLYTPPSIGLAPKTSAPPRDPKAYADFIDTILNKFGKNFEWLELWNEANNLREWDWTLDPEWRIFSQMIGNAAYWAKQCGKKIVLGGMSPIDPNWLQTMCERGIMEYIDAVGIHGFPDTFEYTWTGWEQNVAKIREVLTQHKSNAEIWITEAGYSTWKHEERKQLQEFLNAADAPVERLYWYSVYDLNPELPTVDAFHSDEREYFFGMKKTDGTPKLLFRLLESDGVHALREFVKITSPSKVTRNGKAPVLITGGAGFIGTNLADRLLQSGCHVIIYDNISRPGVERNLRWLKEIHGDRANVEIADTRDPFALRAAVNRVEQVFHFAAQVAVTTSLANPIDDFDINLHGTLNLLEAIRLAPVPPALIFTSTNKVYGSLDDVELASDGIRYEPTDLLVKVNGINENRHLDFHSPYGCSKGAADSYIIDYARIYGIKTVVFRMSCIYGPHQFGTEDQGWVAHFLIRAMENHPITLYGDGMQVRDILFVEDLVNAFLLAEKNIKKLAGQAFNIGGGSQNSISILELLDLIEEIRGRKPVMEFDSWRPGDQRYYVSDTRKFQAATGWKPQVSVHDGIKRLYMWLAQYKGISTARPTDLRGDAESADKTMPAKAGM